MRRIPFLAVAVTGLFALAACQNGTDNQAAGNEVQSEPVRAPVTALPAGTTPMAERVAVLGLLNKRNGIRRDLTLRPGQGIQAGDVIVRLRACETTAPHEPQQLTGAFVQVDVRDPRGQFRRVFSGWLYKESPSLNVVEHPIYDVDVRSCAMTHPGGPPPPAEDASSNRSSAPKSGGTGGSTRRASPRPAADGGENAPAVSNSADNISR